MADITIYTTRYCRFCVRAKQIFDAKNVQYNDIPVDGDAQLRAEMTRKAGQHTVPQIWINEQHIGGCTELMQLDAIGQLDAMLAD